jgi:hypothetical protein
MAGFFITPGIPTDANRHITDWPQYGALLLFSSVADAAGAASVDGDGAGAGAGAVIDGAGACAAGAVISGNGASFFWQPASNAVNTAAARIV